MKSEALAAWVLFVVSAAAVVVPGDLDRSAALAELLAWKASPAGQIAIERGYAKLPVYTAARRVSAAEHVDDDEITRYLDALATIRRLQETQPDAVFSMDTPFALLTHSEFLDHLTVTGTKRKTSPSKEFAEMYPPKTYARPSLHDRPLRPLERPVISTSAARRVEASVAEADAMEVDWQRDGCVSRVQDQGKCRASWAFATIGAIESNFCSFSPEKKLYDLSEQDMITCRPDSDGSCNLFTLEEVYIWLSQLARGSVCTEATMPYILMPVGGDNKSYAPSCPRGQDPSFFCDKPDLHVASFAQKQFPDHRDLEKVVRKRAVTAFISPCAPVQYYKGGVIRGDTVGCPTIDSEQDVYRAATMVLIVGFGVRNGIPVWKVKNSWGEAWGDAGYAYIERGFQGDAYGAAGIEYFATYPLFQSEVPQAYLDSRHLGWRNSVQILGDDLAIAVIADGYASCATACRLQPGCVAYSWRMDSSNTCRLKSSIKGEVFSSTDIWISGSIVSVEQAREYMLPIEDNVDFESTALRSNDMISIPAATAEECADMCLSTQYCELYSWSQYLGGMCYLKEGFTFKRVQKLPAPDGTPCVRSGLVYRCGQLQSDTDFPGDDYQNAPAARPEDCCGMCRFIYCASFTWTDYNGGTCWFKTKQPANGVGVSSPNAFSAIA